MGNRYYFVIFIFQTLGVLSLTALPVVCLLLAAWKGRMVWSGPRCEGKVGRMIGGGRRCGYELRGMKDFKSKQCPECGQYLGEVGAVRYVQGRFSWRVLILTLSLIGVTGVVGGGVAVYQDYQWQRMLETGEGMSLYSMRFDVFLKYLEKHPEEVMDGKEWLWAMDHHLGMKGKQITREEMGKVCEVMKVAMRSEVGLDFLSDYGDRLYQSMAQSGMMDEGMWVELAREWHGGEMRLNETKRQFGGSWMRLLVSGEEKADWFKKDEMAGIRPLWWVKEVTLNGEVFDGVVDQVKRSDYGRREFELRGKGNKRFKAGAYEIEVVIERGFVRVDDGVAFEEPTKREDWPTDVMGLEEQRVSYRCELFEDVDAAVGLVKDETFAAKMEREYSVKRCVARKFRGKVRLVLEMRRMMRVEIGEGDKVLLAAMYDEGPMVADRLKVNLVGEVRFGDQVFELSEAGHSVDWGGFPDDPVIEIVETYVGDVDELGEDVREVDVVLRGERDEWLSRDWDVEGFWDGEIEVKGVKVERWDLGEWGGE
ncbi:hypothetical protein [Poriferisphaera corsica]|nr:hypothetical protein [Poriferisphaera corsica]